MILTWCMLLFGAGGLALFVELILEQPEAAGTMMSSLWREGLVTRLGGRLLPEQQADVPWNRLALLSTLLLGCGWLLGSLLLRWRRHLSWRESFRLGGLACGAWGTACGLWWAIWLVMRLAGWATVAGLMETQVHLFLSLVVAGGVSTLVALVGGGGRLASLPGSTGQKLSPVGSSPWVLSLLWGAMLLYVGVYFTLNARLYANLLIPHGDSAMYEEHLWNLTHGKGFRSYLDPGLFLGEHIQVIHLLLIPLHWLWPSHLLMELCESLALAAGAWPVFLLARRHTCSERIGLLLALTYLCYTPMQYLDIAIDLKTFRPIALGVAPLLMGIDALERQRYGSMAIWLLLALSAEEVYAIPIACLGIWQMLVHGRRWFLVKWSPDTGDTASNSEIASASQAGRQVAADIEVASRLGLIVGGIMFLFASIYLFVTVKYIIPWFKGEETVHYTRYFPQFGETPTEILWNMLTRPGLLWSELVTPCTVVYTLHLLLPIGFLSLLAPVRLAVGLPLWGLLCLNELSRDPCQPVHHFHAPLIPLLFWAAAGGLNNISILTRLMRSERGKIPHLDPPGGDAVSSSAQTDRNADGASVDQARTTAATFALCCSLLIGLFEGIGPQSLPFWDPGRTFYWRELYMISERARLFERVYDVIPRESRVASTDFIHPRFTHHERSYDYSLYPRKVANYEDRVPDDTDFIVIDTRHRYSWIHSPEQVRELQREPERWELLPDETDGYFIVLRRRVDRPDDDVTPLP